MAFEARLSVRERRAPFLWVAFAAIALAYALLSVVHSASLGIVVGTALLALTFTVYGVLNLIFQRRRRDTPLVRAQGGVLTLDGERRFRRVVTAYMLPQRGNASAVRVVGPWFQRADIATPDDAAARELLRSLGIDPERSITRFRVHAGILSNKTGQTVLSALLGFGAFNAFNVFPHEWRVPGAVALGLLSLLNWAPSTVSVGPDGLLVTSPTRLRRKFIPFAEIESAASTSWGVTLTLRSKRTVELRTENQPRSQSETRAALLQRIHAGIAAFDPSTSVDVASLVARGGRPVDEWMRAIEGVTRQAGGYRVAAVPAEKLWRVVEDPAADPTARAGAAAALSGALDDDGRVRLRLAAQNAVHPRVRVALDAAASSDDERMREALEACEEKMEA